jgi:Cys-rich four helix bundle protein (predicted Tat secretion target)
MTLPDTTRRGLLIGAAGVMLAAATGTHAGEAKDAHAGHAMHGGAYAGLASAAYHCSQTGDACIAHCLVSFKAGDTTLAACAASVEEMMAACESMAKLASLNSRHVKAEAAVCKAICEDCEKECRKHEKQHAICKDCADACKDVIAAVKQVLA